MAKTRKAHAAAPRAAMPTSDPKIIENARREAPVRREVAVSAGPPDYGITIVVPDPADLDLGAINTVTAATRFGRAVLFPPGSVDGVANPDQYTFVAYVSQSLGPVAMYIPENAAGLLFADLPDGVAPPAGSTLFDAISSAIKHQIGPNPPDGTGNG